MEQQTRSCLETITMQCCMHTHYGAWIPVHHTLDLECMLLFASITQLLIDALSQNTHARIHPPKQPNKGECNTVPFYIDECVMDTLSDIQFNSNIVYLQHKTEYIQQYFFAHDVLKRERAEDRPDRYRLYERARTNRGN